MKNYEFGAGRPDFGGRWPSGEALRTKETKREVPDVESWEWGEAFFAQ